MSASDSEPGLDALLADFPADMASLTRELRQIVLSQVPEFTERVYRGWRGVGFHHPVAGYVCGLFPGEDEVRLGFERGVHLHDDWGVLDGDGTQVRYVTITDPESIPVEAIGELIDQAVAIGGG